MRTVVLLAALAALPGLITACDRAPEAAPAPSGTAAPPAAPPASGGTGHAPTGAVPGSYEDWCGGHAVPESQCTRCDPSLIPAFKAVNDWCAEHGLPESQCLVCNPDLKIVRPAKTEGA